MHPSDEAVLQRTARLATLVGHFAKYIGRCYAHIGDLKACDTDAVRSKKVRFAIGSPPSLKVYHSRHALFFLNGRIRCLTCQRSALDRASIEAQPCRTHLRHNPHSLREVGGFVFCIVCGCYSSARARGLFGSCPRELTTQRATILRRLLDGRHPQTNAPLASRWPRPVFCDPSVARSGGRSRIWGKQSADLGLNLQAVDISSTSDIDQLLDATGLVADLSLLEGDHLPFLPTPLDAVVDGFGA